MDSSCRPRFASDPGLACRIDQGFGVFQSADDFTVDRRMAHEFIVAIDFKFAEHGDGQKKFSIKFFQGDEHQDGIVLCHNITRNGLNTDNLAVEG